jgi:UPF0755 protein
MFTRKIALAIGVGLSAALLVPFLYIWLSLHQSVYIEKPLEIEIKRGQNLRAVLYALHEQKLLPCPWLLYRFAQLWDGTKIKPGLVKLPNRYTPLALLDFVQHSSIQFEDLLIPEGTNRFQLSKMLVEGRWLTEQEFQHWCNNVNWLKRQKIPGPTCEGYLFPETYRLTRDMDAEKIMLMFIQTYKRHMQQFRSKNGTFGPYHLSEREFVTLASIIEKETGVAQERPRIACVFYNRLHAQPAWRLETDPTVIYAAMLSIPHFDGNLTRKILHSLDNPYNTYMHTGLPPGAIANAGHASMKAVVSPASCPDYFFVANHEGGHIFCPNLKCHEQAVKTYQIDYYHEEKASRTTRAIPVVTKRRKKY